LTNCPALHCVDLLFPNYSTRCICLGSVTDYCVNLLFTVYSPVVFANSSVLLLFSEPALSDPIKSKAREQGRLAALRWAEKHGGTEYSDDSDEKKSMHPPGHFFEVLNVLFTSRILLQHPRLKTLLVHNCDTTGVTCDTQLSLAFSCFFDVVLSICCFCKLCVFQNVARPSQQQMCDDDRSDGEKTRRQRRGTRRPRHEHNENRGTTLSLFSCSSFHDICAVVVLQISKVYWLLFFKYAICIIVLLMICNLFLFFSNDIWV
jgi:hypothetical protein